MLRVILGWKVPERGLQNFAFKVNLELDVIHMSGTGR